MRQLLAVLCLLASTACVAHNPRPASADPERGPVRFAYGALQGEPVLSSAADPRTGLTVRRERLQNGREFAVFDLVQLQGDEGFLNGPTAVYVSRMLKSGPKVAWGGTGTLAAGLEPTGYQSFLLPDGKLACVGLRRRVQEATAGQPEQMLVGIYCRPGAGQIGDGEARAIAAAVHSEGARGLP